MFVRNSHLFDGMLHQSRRSRVSSGRDHGGSTRDSPCALVKGLGSHFPSIFLLFRSRGRESRDSVQSSTSARLIVSSLQTPRSRPWQRTDSIPTPSLSPPISRPARRFGSILRLWESSTGHTRPSRRVLSVLPGEGSASSQPNRSGTGFAP